MIMKSNLEVFFYYTPKRLWTNIRFVKAVCKHNSITNTKTKKNKYAYCADYYQRFFI